jgi:parvulin-like peptidyl-prolyl isomerase
MAITTRINLLLLAGVILVPARASAAQPAQTNTVPAAQASLGATNRIVAKGEGWQITRAQLDKEVTSALAQAAARGRRVSAEQMPEVERQVLEQVVNARLILAKATPADRAAGKAAAESRYVVARTKAGSPEAFDLELKFMVTTGEELKAKWTEALTAEAVLKRELKIVIPDEEARKYYDENRKEFDIAEKVRARHILISTLDPRTGAEMSADQKAEKRKKAEALLKRARDGEDFGKLALAFSNDAGSRARGGEYTFPRGQMPAEIETVAFSLKTNEISDLITTTNGYHIIKLSARLPARKIEFADAAADIKNGLAQQAIEQKFPEYIARLRSEAGVEILEEQLKPQEPGISEPRTRKSAQRPG